MRLHRLRIVFGLCKIDIPRNSKSILNRNPASASLAAPGRYLIHERVCPVLEGALITSGCLPIFLPGIQCRRRERLRPRGNGTGSFLNNVILLRNIMNTCFVRPSPSVLYQDQRVLVGFFYLF